MAAVDPSVLELVRWIVAGVSAIASGGGLFYNGTQYKRNRRTGRVRDARVTALTDEVLALRNEIRGLKKRAYNMEVAIVGQAEPLTNPGFPIPKEPK